MFFTSSDDDISIDDEASMEPKDTPQVVPPMEKRRESRFLSLAYDDAVKFQKINIEVR